MTDIVAPLRAYAWADNAELIEHAHLLGVQAGWWPDPAVVMDVTYGKGLWWTRFRPPGLITHDIDRETVAGDGVDFRHLPEADGTVNVVAYDPPYVGVGGVETSTIGDFQRGYGLHAEASRRPDDVTDAHIAGLVEIRRVLVPMRRKTKTVAGRRPGVVLFKCMNYVEGGRYRLCAYDAIAAAQQIGYRVVDEFVHLSGTGPQPGCRTCNGRGILDIAMDTTSLVARAYEPRTSTTVGTMMCTVCGGTGEITPQHTRANYSHLFVLRRHDGR